MLALLVPGVGMGGGGTVASPVAARSIWLTYEDRLTVALSYDDRLALDLTYENAFEITLTDQSHAG